jgi:TRAP-type C4-dicarboxylate transport system permease small subunit
MYFAGLVAIGWMYVTLMMAITQPTVIAGIATFFFYGLLPVSIIVYVMLAPERGRLARLAAARSADAGGVDPAASPRDVAEAGKETSPRT